jgi:hypothetical protein
MGTVTYSELKRRYPTNAPGASWYGFPERELKADLRFAAQLRALDRHTPESAGGRVIEGWITQELQPRRRRRRDVAAYVR